MIKLALTIVLEPKWLAITATNKKAITKKYIWIFGKYTILKISQKFLSKVLDIIVK